MPERYLTKNDDCGSVNISEDVITNIVIKAAKEVEGVSGLANTAGAELAERIGIKTVPKGVRSSFNDGHIVIDIIIFVSYGSNVLKVAGNVQDNVRRAIESGTGFDSPTVNVHVSGISFEKNS